MIRCVYERRVRLALGEPPTVLQVEAANSYAYIGSVTDRAHITEQTANILKRRAKVFAAPLLADTRPLNKARYLRRWARRLKEFRFSSEDAIILAYGSFGLDVGSQRVGVDAIITLYGKIENRFHDMTLNLPEPYKQLRLPQVVTTATVLTFV